MYTYPIHQIRPAQRKFSLGRACLQSCQRLLSKLSSVKASVIAEFQQRRGAHAHLVELAVNEAEALAWQTGVPELVFPVLAEENAQAVGQWHDRQERMRSKWRSLAQVR